MTRVRFLPLQILVVLYAVARTGQAFPDRLPMLAIVAAHVLFPLIFAFIHGARVYAVRGILIFMLICLAIGNLFENLSILTGFPFGRYHFTNVMGPKLLNVPVLLGLAYIGMGYLSWTLGGIILGESHGTPRRVFARPLVAACLMVAWDLSMDPIWSNLVHGWIWHDGGAWFGVPVGNFFGWYLTVYVIFQSFALYLRGEPGSPRPLPAAFWRTAVLMYAVSAAGNLFVIAAPGAAVLTDASGTAWKVHDMLGASMLVSVFTMGAFALIAWVRIRDE